MTCNIPFVFNYSNYNGDYSKYETDVYNEFIKCYRDNKVYLFDDVISFKTYPIVNDKNEAFWHMTSTKGKNGIRYPDFKRYETITWSKHLLDICMPSSHICSMVWMKKHRNKYRILVYCETLDYLIILEIRKSYILFITSYPISFHNMRKDLYKEYNSNHVIKLR